MKRKTIKETQAFYRSSGFDECLQIFINSWRTRISIFGKNDTIAANMWETIEYADCESSRLDSEYKKLYFSREPHFSGVPDIDPGDLEEFNWKCYCNKHKVKE